MSDLYLVLRERLQAVAEEDWIPLSGSVLIEARRQRGLSREALGARIHVASKTIERWEKNNKVKRASLPALARELGLQIEEPKFEPIILPPTGSPLDEQAGAVLRELAAIRAALAAGQAQDRRLARLEKKVDQLLSRQEPQRRRSRAADSSESR